MFLSHFELRRFRRPLPRLALLFAALVPVIYGAVYLAANWDPYGRLADLPVAVVDHDRPVTYDGRSVHAGRDFTRDLVAGHEFDWHVTNDADAEAGLREGRYYLTVTVPAGFSADLVSGSTDHPRRAQITMRRNDANGFVIGSVTGQAQGKITEAVDRTAVRSYFDAVFANLRTIRAGMTDARNGSQQLTDGLSRAHTGSSRLASGAGDLDSGATRLASGARRLDHEYGALETGAGSLESGLGRLGSGSLTLSSGASQVAAGTQELSDTAGPVLDTAARLNTQVRGGAARIDASVQKVAQQAAGDSESVDTDLDHLQSALDAVAAANPSVAGSPAYRDAQQRLHRARTRNDTLAHAAGEVARESSALNGIVQSSPTSARLAEASRKLDRLDDGAHEVARGAERLHRGIDDARGGAGRLTTGVTKAGGAIHELSTGATTLSDGAKSLHGGATTLDTGIGRLHAGSTKLTKGLADGVRRVPALTEDEADGAAQVLSAPTRVDAVVENPATFYGRGLAPLFFSIAMWVFGISGFLVMRPISGRLLAGRMNPVRLTLSAFAPFAAVAVTGALLMLAVVAACLPLAPVHGVALVGLVLLTAVVFALVAHMLRTALGLPGSALLLVLLVLQLSSTGGTYPADVLPTFFRWLHPVMPITYSIDAFRVAISGGLWSHYVLDVAVLAGIGLVALVLDTLAVVRRQRFRLGDLHPPL